MARSLSNLANNCSQGVHRIKYQHRNDDKKFETFRIKYKYCDCFPEWTNFKHNLIDVTADYFQ